MTSPLANARRIVVKTGSSLIASPDGTAKTDWLASLASDIANWRKQDRDVLLVTSGAVAIGRPILGSKGQRLDEKQAAAALGQPRLMSALDHAFAPHDLRVAQALLTPDDTENRRRWLNARATLETLLEAGAVPVINENDTVATEEIRYGDNDRLAARVAQMVSADVLILLSDVDGLYTSNPRHDPDAAHIPVISELTPDIEAMAGGADAKGVGSGGMTTKLLAARIARNAGCATAITLGSRTSPLAALETGAKTSWILPDVSPDTARKSWLKGHLNPQGVLTIDAGAADALRSGASLLPIGVIEITGQFERGAALSVQTQAGAIIAKGITAYSAADIRAIAGQHTDKVADILGVTRRPAIIHRNDIALTD